MHSVDGSLHFASGICLNPCVSDVKAVFSRHQSSAVNLTMSWSSSTRDGSFQRRARSSCSTKICVWNQDDTNNTGQRRTRASNHQEISAAASNTIRERTEKESGGTLFHPSFYLCRWVYPSFQAWPMSKWKFAVCSVYMQRRQVNRTTLIDLFQGERMK